MPDAPRAAKRPYAQTLHGIPREDPYHWLRDDNWQDVMQDPAKLDPEIRAHLEAENAHTEAVLAPTAALRETLFAELEGRIKQDDSSVPAKHGPWAYFHRYLTGAQHPRYCRHPVENPEAVEVLYDADAEAKAHKFFSVGMVHHAPDHRRLALATDTKGSEFFTIAFKDLRTGTMLPDRLENTSGSAVWAADGETLFYTVLDARHRPYKVLRHRVGTDPSDDVLVYEDTDPGFFLGVGLTEDHRHIVIDAHDHTTSELRIVDARTPDQTPRLISARKAGREYELSALGETFVILTNEDAEDFKLVEAPVADPGPENWRELVPHRPGRLILGVVTFAGFIVRLEREGGLPRIVVRRRDDGNEHTIEFEEQAYALGLVPGYEYDTPTLRFTYASLTTPDQVFDYDMNTRERTLLKQREIPSGHDPGLYLSKRIFATGHDGEEVPISLLWHRDTPIDGTAPALLYGYGSYGHAMPASFAGSRFSLVNRGFVYALAHVRGGKDKGYAWYRRGKLMEKHNTFLDFIAAADHLCEAGYTKAGNITLEGGSAGGMLVGVAANMRPALFRAVVGQVPFVDVLNTMCDGSLPLTPPEWPEWGNPIEDPEAYAYIASYSPYDNVRTQTYPHILATAGLTDPRVTYWEPAKWIARLRDHQTDRDRMLLLKCYMEAGHGGAAGRFEKLREVALTIAFVLLAHDRVQFEPLPAC